jgi:hypothetical protein
MKKTPMPKGNALASNRTPAAGVPMSKVQMPASRKAMPKSKKVSRGKAEALP